MVMSHINGERALSDDEFTRADVNKSGSADVEDVAAIIAHINGIKALS